MKIKMTLSIGLHGSQDDEIEFPDDYFEGLTEEEKVEKLHEEWKEWAWNFIDGSASIIEQKPAKKDKP